MLGLLEHFAGKRHVIWDWNGTLLDDVDLSASIIAEMLVEHGLPPIDKETYLGGFRFPIHEYYAELGFAFDRVPYVELNRQFIRLYKSQMAACARLYSGVSELLVTLESLGIVCSVLSAAQQDDLVQVLKRHGIHHHFTLVYGLSDHHAVSKIERGRELMAALNTDPEHLILVGDTDHDLAVAEAMGIDAVLVGAGHQALDRLSALHHRVFAR